MKKKRKRGPAKEAERLAKRQARNPRKRNRRNRIKTAKVMEAVEHGIQVDTRLSGLGRGKTRLQEGRGEDEVGPDERSKVKGGETSGIPEARAAAGKQHKNATVESITEQGVTILKWDGIKPIAILAKGGEAFVVCAGRPEAASYVEDLISLEEKMLPAADKLKFPGWQANHSRGTYKSVSIGVTHGRGSKAPKVLQLGGGDNAKIVEDIMKHRGMARIAGFTRACVQAYAPDLYNFVMGVLESTRDGDETLRYPFKKHPFSAITLNIGPDVITIPHTDWLDLVGGWCSVTSLGNYDPTKGGHLILWDLNLAIEFPPYSTIFFPSALLRHSNTEIQEGERRSSITQYNSSGLFRWVAFNNSLKEGREKSGKSWWDKPVGMFRKLAGNIFRK